MALIAAGVRYAYRGDAVPAVAGVDLAIEPGRVYGLFGRNGSGKSTLLKLLARELAPDAGSVVLGGRPLGGFGRRELARRIAVVEQEVPGELPFTVGECVGLGRYAWRGLAASDAAAVAGALAACDLEALRDRPYNRLSGGMKQRVMLARALAQAGEYLLCDEPAGRFDLAHLVEFYQLVRRLAAAGRAVVIACHDLYLAPEAVDVGILLKEGRVAAAGKAPELFTEAAVIEAFGCPLPTGFR